MLSFVVVSKPTPILFTGNNTKAILFYSAAINGVDGNSPTAMPQRLSYIEHTTRNFPQRFSELLLSCWKIQVCLAEVFKNSM